MCQSECWRLARASKQRTSEAVLEHCLGLLPPSLLSSATPSGEQREAEAGTDWGTEQMREEESGKQKTKEEKQRLKTLGIRQPGRDGSEIGMKA